MHSGEHVLVHVCHNRCNDGIDCWGHALPNGMYTNRRAVEQALAVGWAGGRAAKLVDR